MCLSVAWCFLFNYSLFMVAVQKCIGKFLYECEVVSLFPKRFTWKQFPTVKTAKKETKKRKRRIKRNVSYQGTKFLLLYYPSFEYSSLRCARTTLHMNLFASFAVNNALWLVWYRCIVANTDLLLNNEVRMRRPRSPLVLSLLSTRPSNSRENFVSRHIVSVISVIIVSVSSEFANRPREWISPLRFLFFLWLSAISDRILHNLDVPITLSERWTWKSKAKYEIKTPMYDRQTDVPTIGNNWNIMRYIRWIYKLNL